MIPRGSLASRWAALARPTAAAVDALPAGLDLRFPLAHDAELGDLSLTMSGSGLAAAVRPEGSLAPSGEGRLRLDGLRLTAHAALAWTGPEAARAARGSLFAAARLAGTAPDDRLTLARSYRAQLLQPNNPYGNHLVDLYYRHNPVLTEIVNGNNTFTHAWVNYPTNGKTTAYFAQQTTLAAQTPAGQNAPTINDQDYNDHAAKIAEVLMVYAGQQSKAPGDAYAALASDVASFQGQMPAPGPTTVGAVMTQVAQTPASRPTYATADAAGQARHAELRAEARAWVAAHERALGSAPDEAGPTRQPFELALALGDVVAAVEIAPTGELARLSVELPPIALGPTLEGLSGAAAVSARAALGRADWLARLLARRLEAALAAPAVLRRLGAVLLAPAAAS